MYLVSWHKVNWTFSYRPNSVQAMAEVFQVNSTLLDSEVCPFSNVPLLGLKNSIYETDSGVIHSDVVTSDVTTLFCCYLASIKN